MRWASMAAFLCVAAAQAVSAQTTDLPVPFDTAGKVRTLTPPLVARLGLEPPVWPVQGDFVEARLFATSAGGHVIAVERRTGAFDRYPVTDSALVNLRYAVNSALVRSGAIVTEERAQLISEPAGGAFVRNQMGLAFGLYGPLIASAFRSNEKTAVATYLLATGASYFITTEISRKTAISRAQNNLATDGAVRGWGLASGLWYAAAGEGDEQTYSVVGLAGALGGAFAGYKRGARLTDSEVESTTSFSNFGALTAFGLSGATGLAQHSHDDGRTVVGAVLGGGVLGYALGPLYPRRAKYTVTRGDIQMLSIGGILGAAAAFTPFANEDNADSQAAAGAATMGFVAGIFAADRLISFPYDYTTSDAGQVSLGVGAGALMGAAVAILTEPPTEATVGLVTAGGILGAVAGHRFAQPARANSGAVRVGSADRFHGAAIEINPAGVLLGASGVPGTHGMLRVRF